MADRPRILERWWRRLPVSVQIRLPYLLLAVGMAGMIDGTLRVGAHPSWPRPAAWAILAGAALVAQLAALVWPRAQLEAVALFTTAVAITSRGAGYVVFPSERLGFNGAAPGAYAIGAGLLLVIWQRARHHPPTGKNVHRAGMS